MAEQEAVNFKVVGSNPTRGPVIFGDGSQKRDFIFIEDVVDQIIDNSKRKTGIVEIGSGQCFSFNSLIQIIENATGGNIDPVYGEKPNTYVEETKCTGGKAKTSLKKGIKEYWEYLNG